MCNTKRCPFMQVLDALEQHFDCVDKVWNNKQLKTKFKTFVLTAESLWSWRGSADSWANGGYHPFWEDPYWIGAEYHLLPLQGQGCRPWAMKLLRPQIAWPGYKGSGEGGWELKFLQQQMHINDVQFRHLPGCSTTDAIFTVCQLQELFCVVNMKLYMTFVNLEYCIIRPLWVNNSIY